MPNCWSNPSSACVCTLGWWGWEGGCFVPLFPQLMPALSLSDVVQDVGERAAGRVLVCGPHPREGDPGRTNHPRGPRVPPLLHSPRAGGPGSTCPTEPVDRCDPASWRQFTMAPVLDFTWVSACLFRLWRRLGLCPVCCPPSTAAWLLGRGGTMGGEGRWGGCKEEGLLSYSLSPNISQRTGLFLLLALWPCPPCCFEASARTLQHRALCASRYLLGDKTPCHGWEGAKKQRKTKYPFPPLSLLSPRPKTVNTVSRASCVLPVPCAPAQPSVLVWDAV